MAAVNPQRGCMWYLYDDGPNVIHNVPVKTVVHGSAITVPSPYQDCNLSVCL